MLNLNSNKIKRLQPRRFFRGFMSFYMQHHAIPTVLSEFPSQYRHKFSAALKRPASAVRFRPWPPSFQQLSESQKRAKFSLRVQYAYIDTEMCLAQWLHISLPMLLAAGDVLTRQLQIVRRHLILRMAERLCEV